MNSEFMFLETGKKEAALTAVLGFKSLSGCISVKGTEFVD